jgi:tetratricopeptide (TPR) repeat protein
MRALHLAETIHAQGNSKLAIAICERALGANNDYYAYACLGDIMMDLGKEDEAREYYTKAATLWPPGTVSNLTAEYYENRGLHGDAGRYRDRAAAELAACYSRWLAVHVVVLVVSLAILFVCGWVVVTRSFRLRARALLAVAAAGLMAIYLHVLFPQHEVHAVATVYLWGVFLLGLANAASAVGALAAVARTLIVKRRRTAVNVRSLPLELLLVLPGGYAVVGAGTVFFMFAVAGS